MFESGQNWELFGYDMRNAGRHWTDAWTDLLWADDSPVRRHLDDAVQLHSGKDVTTYQGGRPSKAVAGDYSAVLLPDDLVLTRNLVLPRAVEIDLAAALSLEVGACSPFSQEDTSYGWRIVSRDEARITLLLVIVSRSAAMSYLGRQYDVHDPRQLEVWAKVLDEIVVLRGFGEARREKSYRNRLVRAAVLIGTAAILLLVLAGTAAGMKALELQQVQQMAATTERDTTAAARMRTSLAATNEMITAVNRIIDTYPNPHLEISRLTHLLKDGEFVENLAMHGSQLELRGQALDAASVMRRLTDEEDYAEVTAPRAITRERNSRNEQFFLNIQLREAPGLQGVEG